LFLVPLASEVNAGSVSMYSLCKDPDTKKEKTKYLNELKQGDELITMNSDENESFATIEKSKIMPMYMFYIKGKYRILGSHIFSLIDREENYFNYYRDIFHLKEKITGKPIHVLDIEKYREKKRDICAYLDVATIVPDLRAKQIKIGDKIKAYIQMPGLDSRHFGMNYGGNNDTHCLER
jgi:3-dehydroquinate synthase class II